MPSLFDMFASDFVIAESDIPQWFTWDAWSGSQFPCVAGDVDRTKDHQDGGFADDVDVTIECRIELFTGGAYPGFGSQITLQPAGRALKVQRVDQHQDSTTVGLECVDEHG